MNPTGYTVYDADYDNGGLIPGGYVAAIVVETQADADLLLARYRAEPKRYDVRPCTIGAVAHVAQEIAAQVNAARTASPDLAKAVPAQASNIAAAAAAEVLLHTERKLVVRNQDGVIASYSIVDGKVIYDKMDSFGANQFGAYGA